MRKRVEKTTPLRIVYIMAKDLKATASELRAEAHDLRQKAKQLETAADILDPVPSQKDLLIINPPPSGLSGQHQTSAKLFSDLTVAKAAETLLLEAGKPLSREEIFEAIKKRGGSVSKVENLISALSRSRETFVSLGNKTWDLRARRNAQQ